MTKQQDEPWRHEIDMDRVAADPRSIAAGWVIVVAMIVLGVFAPSVAPLVNGGGAAPAEASAQPRPQPSVVAQCVQPAAAVVR